MKLQKHEAICPVDNMVCTNPVCQKGASCQLQNQYLSDDFDETEATVESVQEEFDIETVDGDDPFEETEWENPEE